MSQLKQLMEQIDSCLSRIDQEKEHLKDIKKKAKSDGYDISVINRITREKRMDAQKLKEHEDIYHSYQLELGLLLE